jgi:hypothetical protein
MIDGTRTTHHRRLFAHRLAHRARRFIDDLGDQAQRLSFGHHDLLSKKANFPGVERDQETARPQGSPVDGE